MLELDFMLERQEALENPYFDDYTLEQLFEQMRHEQTQAITRKLGALRCAVHDTAPRVRVVVRCDDEQGQLDIDYSVDACCQAFLVQVVSRLHRVG